MDKAEMKFVKMEISLSRLGVGPLWTPFPPKRSVSKEVESSGHRVCCGACRCVYCLSSSWQRHRCGENVNELTGVHAPHTHRHIHACIRRAHAVSCLLHGPVLSCFRACPCFSSRAHGMAPMQREDAASPAHSRAIIADTNSFYHIHIHVTQSVRMHWFVRCV